MVSVGDRSELGAPQVNTGTPMPRERSVRFAIHLLLRDRAALLGVTVFIAIVTGAVFGPRLCPYDPLDQNLVQRLQPARWCNIEGECHLLGTDQLGRDILSRLLLGARVSLLVGFSAVVIGGSVGTLTGLICGYYGGRLDSVIMRLADAQLAIPFIMLAIAVISVLGPGLANLTLVLGLTGWVDYARIVRSSVLSVREKQFVSAARSVGASDFRILFAHIVPNSLEPAVIIASSQLASRIVAEASLSFLGLGVPPPIPTWGNMLADGRNYIMTNAWWLATFPGLALTITTLSINLIGDWVRDLLDPRLWRYS